MAAGNAHSAMPTRSIHSSFCRRRLDENLSYAMTNPLRVSNCDRRNA
jgi:hypothetical protein